MEEIPEREPLPLRELEVRRNKTMATIRPIKLYAVVSKKKPRLSYLDIFQDRDVKMTKDEELWEIEVKPIKRVRIKPEVPRRRTGHAHKAKAIPKARKTQTGTSTTSRERR